ncbi:MAG: helix-turn-helix domain-containing protein [Desulfosarcinaceae bacterium]|nr:helix-turn-helix domain-containing protein [Desulfosarcinaceae bacterium]
MRQFPNRIRNIIQASGLKLNTISKTSGVSHTYLTKLVNDSINRPGKDKIASVMLALNFSISEINQTLAEYDYRPLNTHDIPSILSNNLRRKIEGNTLSLYDHLHMRLLLSPLERLEGARVLVKGSPSVLFMPEELYLGQDKAYAGDGDAQQFYLEFNRALFRERKENQLHTFEAGYRSETYCCRKCLEAYLEAQLRDTSDGHRHLIATYFGNILRALKQHPDQQLMRVVERCTYFDFQLQGADQAHPKVFFLGRKPHTYDAVQSQLNLQGFSSDGPAMIALFLKETDSSRRASIPRLEKNYPEKLIDYFVDLFQRHGMGDHLAAAIAGDGAA